MRILDLFSGIGGFALGLEWAGFPPPVAFCEIDPFCQKVLKKHWPDVPIYDDVRKLNADEIGPVDLICGGYPCQPFSTATRGRPRAASMRAEFTGAVRTFRPTWVLAENVPKALDEIERFCSELPGYEVAALVVDTALPERQRARHRAIIVANADGYSKSWISSNAKVARLPEDARRIREARPSPVGVDDGVPHRMDRLRALGNAVVPQVVCEIGRAIRAVS